MAQLMGLEIVDFDQNINFASGEISLTVNLAACDDTQVFVPPSIGTPVSFTFGTDFFGILDRYVKNESPQENYSVYITNGLHILGGVKIILSDYTGYTDSVDNLMNVYGKLGFDSNFVGEKGIYWEAVRDTVVDFTVTPDQYGAQIKWAGNSYGIDLSDLPLTVPADFIVSGDNISLLDFISECCSLAGHEYYIDIVSAASYGSYSGYAGVFVVRTIDRTAGTDTAALANWVESLDTCVISKSLGIEMRKGIHNKFVLGANVESMYFNYPQNRENNTLLGGITKAQYADDTILPYFGLDTSNNAIIGYTPEGTHDYYFNIDIRDIDIPDLGPSYLTCTAEIRAAKMGRESWQRFLDERNANQYMIDESVTGASDPTITGWEKFSVPLKATDLAAANLANPIPIWMRTLPDPSPGYVSIGIPKFGAVAALNIKTFLPSLRILAPASFSPLYETDTPANPTSQQVGDSALLHYPRTEALNPYWGRGSIMKAISGWHYAYARMFEWDLQYRATTGNANYYQQFEAVYNNYVSTLGIGDSVFGNFVYNHLKTNSLFDDVLEDSATDRVGQLYARLKDLGENYYNKRFMVRTPNVETGYDYQAEKIKESYEVTDTGYLDEALWDQAEYLGIIPTYENLNKLTDQNNKFYPFIKFDNAYLTTAGGAVQDSRYDLSEIGYNDKILQYTAGKTINKPGGQVIGNSTFASGDTPNIVDVWVKCSMLENIVYDDVTDPENSPARVVIELPGTVTIPSHYSNKTVLGRRALVNAVDLVARKFGLEVASKINTVPGLFKTPAPTGTEVKELIGKLSSKVVSDAPKFDDGEELTLGDMYAVPLRSKTASYGPWVSKSVGTNITGGGSSSFDLGGPVEYSKHENLAPWNFGGFTNMHKAGNALASGTTAQNQDGTGSVQVEGSPAFRIGQKVAANAPHISDISVRFSESGTTTEYRFQSWSEHNSLVAKGNHIIKRFDEKNKKLIDLERNYREGLKKKYWSSVQGMKADLAGKFSDLQKYARKDQSNTSSTMITADAAGGKPTVAIQPFYNTGSQVYGNYEGTASVSLEGLFTPYSTVENDVFPNITYVEPTSSGEPTSGNLIPFHSGRAPNVITKGLDPNYEGMTDGITGMPLQSGSGVPVYRSVGLKAPLMLTGWGYDTNGKPVPSDPENSGRFHPEYATNNKLWKSGPLDVRWDEERGVWTGGSEGTAVETTVETTVGTCCEYVTTPDVILSDGTKTVRRRILCDQLNPIIEKQEFGTLTLTFPTPAEMVLVKEDDSDYYIWPISDSVFSAKYSNGSGVEEGDYTPSGEVSFIHNISSGTYCGGCPKMRLRVEWDGVIPNPYASGV